MVISSYFLIALRARKYYFLIHVIVDPESNQLTQASKNIMCYHGELLLLLLLLLLFTHKLNDG